MRLGDENFMIMKIDAIVREEKFEDVKNALMEIEVNGLTVSQVMGCGLQRGNSQRYGSGTSDAAKD